MKKVISIILILCFLFTSLYVANAAEEIINISVQDGNNIPIIYQVPAANVKNTLNYLNITLKDEDTIYPSLKTPLTENMTIKINRVFYKKIIKTQKINFKTKKKATSKLYTGQKKIKAKGQKGLKKIIYTKKIVNGKVRKTIISNVKTIKKPKSKVVLVGVKRKNYYMIANNPTKVKTKNKGGIGIIRDHNGKKIAYKQKISGLATAYSFDAGSLTATGETVHIGGVAVNPNQIPYGSRLYIESPDGKLVYGYARAIDTGGFAYDGSGVIVDLFYPTIGNCYQFGYRTMNIYVLK